MAAGETLRCADSLFALLVHLSALHNRNSRAGRGSG